MLQVSSSAYAEICGLLEAADYDHAFGSDDGRETIDLHGIALIGPEAAPAAPLADEMRRGTAKFVNADGSVTGRSL